MAESDIENTQDSNAIGVVVQRPCSASFADRPPHKGYPGIVVARREPMTARGIRLAERSLYYFMHPNRMPHGGPC